MNSQMNTHTAKNPGLQACAWDASYEFSDKEIAAEMANVIQPSLFNQSDPHMAPEDFERVYQWFLS